MFAFHAKLYTSEINFVEHKRCICVKYCALSSSATTTKSPDYEASLSLDH